MTSRRVLGGVEAGGTKFVCVTGTRQDGIIDRARIATRDPTSTLADVGDFFRAADATGRSLVAIGVAAFGPIELRPDHPDHGRLGLTPKPGWSHADLLGPLRDLGVPLALDTDVNGAALAELRWGAARGCDPFAYITVGTGIGGGVIVGGRALTGLVHPEIGHVSVPRVAGDGFPGSCPFHGDCLEGMASGPAIAARWGRAAHELTGDDRARAVDLEAAYLAAGIRNLVYTVAPRRVVIGGGVSNLPGLIPAIERHLRTALGGYPDLPEHGDGFVVPAGCGDDAGALGALELAARV